MQTDNTTSSFDNSLCLLLSIMHSFRPNTFWFILRFLTHRPLHTEKPSPNTSMMLGLQRDRVPEWKAWGMTSDTHFNLTNVK